MDQYRIRKDGFKELRKKNMLRILPLLIIASAGGIALSILNTKPSEADTMIFVVPLVGLMLCFIIYTTLKKSMKTLETYVLTVTGHSITRTQAPLPDLTIHFNEITQIARHRNGNIIITGKHKNDMLVVVPQVESFTELEEKLRAIQPFADYKAASILNNPLLSILVVGMMICFYAFQNKIVTGICGPLLAGLLTWSLVAIQRNKNLDKKTRQRSWLVLLPLVSIIYITIMILTDNE